LKPESPLFANYAIDIKDAPGDMALDENRMIR
jgi:hypothetical protein